MAILTDLAQIRTRLMAANSVAVLGAHTKPERPATYVPAYLHQQGLEVWSVNPTKVGEPSLGRAFLGALTDVSGPVDFVDVFRRSDQLMGHLDEILNMQPRPPLVWLQLGIENLAFAEALSKHGIDVVQNRCTLADHQRWSRI